jgi:acetyltransferase-like isoleucine patch superfamily enzyme
MGTLEFAGYAYIGHGCKLSVLGTLRLGNNFTMSAESSIVAHLRVEIGDDVLIAWDVLIIDSDFHHMLNEFGQKVNLNLPVVIGNNVWIGCRSLILKGVSIADGVVVAAATTICKPCIQKKVLIGGNPARILRSSVEWTR